MAPCPIVFIYINMKYGEEKKTAKENKNKIFICIYVVSEILIIVSTGRYWNCKREKTTMQLSIQNYSVFKHPWCCSPSFYLWNFESKPQNWIVSIDWRPKRWYYGLSKFQGRDVKIDRFLAKNQHSYSKDFSKNTLFSKGQ